VLLAGRGDEFRDLGANDPLQSQASPHIACGWSGGKGEGGGEGGEKRGGGVRQQTGKIKLHSLKPLHVYCIDHVYSMGVEDEQHCDRSLLASDLDPGGKGSI
jgi:hypothetical protein